MTRNDDPKAETTLTSLPDPAQRAADDALLAAFFTAGKQQLPDPGEALMARILDAGLAEQAKVASAQRPNSGQTAMAPAPRGFGSWLANLGGWGAVTGLATATVAGIWLGFSPPTGLAGLADGVLGTSLSGNGETIDQVDLLPTFESYLTEG
jgi:hypothetical protein